VGIQNAVCRKEVLRELGSGKVGYNKYELVNVMVNGKEDGWSLLGWLYI
jgi:hypothetical protein